MTSKKSPEVSICIPAFGRPMTLALALRSSLSQAFQGSLEVIVGDDSSGDLEGVISSFQDERIVYLRNPERLGMANNWNSVLDASRGKYIALLMDDDFLLPGFLKRTTQSLDSDPGVGVAFTNHYFIRNTHAWVRNCALEPGTYHNFTRRLLEYRPVAVSAALMRREAWDQARPLPNLLTADMALHLRIAQHGWAFTYVDHPLMAYRVHVGQLSSSRDQFRHDGVELWRQFAFEDAECEELRRRYLAEALDNRAAAFLARDQYDLAARDVEESLALRPASQHELRRRAIRFAIANPRLGSTMLSLLTPARAAFRSLLQRAADFVPRKTSGRTSTLLKSLDDDPSESR